MSDSPAELASELEELRARLATAEETLRAIRSGEVDALVIDGPKETQVYTLKSAAEPYRLLVEQMAQGALTVSQDGLVLFCNESFAQLLDQPREQLLGTRLQDHLGPVAEPKLYGLLHGGQEPGREIAMRQRNGKIVETYVSSVPLSIEGDQVRCVVVTDLSQQELRLRHAAVLEASRDVIYTLDDQLVIQTWNRGAELLSDLSPAQAIGRSEKDLWPPDRRAELEHLVHRVQDTGGAISIDTVRQREDGSRVDLIYTLTPIHGRGGHLIGYSVVAHDITKRKEAEAQRAMLLGELNHRVKNTLATVQSVATQTLRGRAPVAEERAAFEARLIALSKLHDLLTNDNWQGAALREVVLGELAPYGAGESERITVDGPDVQLNPKAALALGMAVHELATNAAKYGALSCGIGTVEITWTVEGDRLRLRWRERDGPPVEPPSRKGFGSRLIENGLAHELDGVVRLDYAPEGIVCAIDIPAPAEAG